MLAFLLYGLIEPLDEILHPSCRFKRCGGLKHHTQTLAVRSECLDMVRHFLVVPAMLFILGAVFQEHAVQLLDVIFSQRDSVMTIEDHFHRVCVTRYFLLVATGKRLGFHPGEQLLYFRIGESGTFDTRGRTGAFNRGYPPEAG